MFSIMVNPVRTIPTLYLLFLLHLRSVVLMSGEKSGGTTVHQEKIIIFSSFSSFVIALIILHCCLKHRKLRSEKRQRACLDCEEGMPRLESLVVRKERHCHHPVVQTTRTTEAMEYGNFVII